MCRVHGLSRGMDGRRTIYTPSAGSLPAEITCTLRSSEYGSAALLRDMGIGALANFELSNRYANVSSL